MIKPIKIRMRKSSDSGIFHNSREDCQVLMKVCNELVAKVNELTDEVNRLSEKQE